MRDGNWVYVEYYDEAKSELYNLAEGPKRNARPGRA